MPKRPCIVLIASFPESIISFRGQLITSFLAKGLGVHVVSPGVHVGSVVRSELEVKGVLVHEVPMTRTGTNPFNDIQTLLILLRILRRIRPDIVLSYTAKPVIYGSLAAWMVRVPNRFALVTGLGYAFTGNRQSLLTKLVQHLYRFSIGKTDKVLFQNPDDQARFIELGILSKRTPSVIVNGSGVDITEFRETDLPAGPVRFLMISRFLGDKGVREYAAAAKIVRLRHPELKFCLVGWIDENPDAISQAELNAWVKDGTITYLGRLDDVRPAIKNSSVYVLPSYREGTPRTVLEAMAMGRAIITTDAPGCRETVIEGENGYLVPVASVSALVDAMLSFMKFPETIANMGQRSRNIAEEKYDVRKVNERMMIEMGIV